MTENKKSGQKHQKVSTAQREARIQAAKDRQAKAEAKKARSEKTKKILTVIVCVILVLALGIPTVALSVLAG